MSRETSKTENEITRWVSNGMKAAFWGGVIGGTFILFQQMKKEINRPMNHQNTERPVIQNKPDTARSYKL
jgi:hypothetical protein